MPIQSLSRANGGVSLPKFTRKDVKTNQLFQYLDDKGKAKGAVFAALPYSPTAERYFSIATSGADKKNGLLFGNKKGTSPVAVVGKFEFNADLMAKKNHVSTTRSKLEPGDIFQVPASKQARANPKHKPPLYVHVGDASNGKLLVSYNLNTRNIAVGKKANGKVVKVGVVKLHTESV